MSVDRALSDFYASFPGWGIVISRQNERVPFVVKLARPPEDPNASITDGRSWSVHYEAADTSLDKAIYDAMTQARIRLSADGDTIG